MTAWRRVQRTEDARVKAGILAGFRLSKEVSVLMLDAKHLRIKGKVYTWYLAFDAERREPLSWILLPRYELRAGYDRILGLFREKGVAVQGIVSDWHKGLLASVKDHYPGAVHQHCAAHVLIEVFAKLHGKRLVQSKEGRALWARVRHVGIGAESLKKARAHLATLRRTHPEHEAAWRCLAHHLPSIYEWTKLPGILENHRTSNRIENCMGQVEARLKTMRGLKSPDAAARTLSSLLKLRRPTKK